MGDIFQSALAQYNKGISRPATKQELFAQPNLALTPDVDKIIGRLSPKFNAAVKVAEGNEKNFGVLSVETDSPDEADKVLNTSIKNNFVRWLQAGQPSTFVDFFQQRWAPLGVSNDPNNLNQNWAGNVKKSLKSNLSEEDYQMLLDNNILDDVQEMKEVQGIGDSLGTFKEAFGNARRSGLKEFEWQGKRYTTKVK